MKTKRLMAIVLMVAILLASIPFSASADVVLPEGMSAETAFEVSPNSSDSFLFEGFETYNQNVWLKVTLKSRGVLNFKCTKLADSAGSIDYTYFYMYKNIDVAAAIKKGEEVDTDVAIWNDYYYPYQNLAGDYNFNIPLNKGTYYICIDSGVGYGDFREMDWTLKFTSTSSYEMEPNNGANTSTAMTLNKTISGYTNGSDDYFSLSLTKNTPIRLYIGGYASLKSKYVNIHITLPDGTSEYVSSYDVCKDSTGYYYDVYLKKGLNVIHLSSKSPAIKYTLKASTSISYAAPSITDVKKTNYSNYDASIKWKETNGIDGYEVYQKTGTGSWKKVYTSNSGYTTGVNIYSLKKTAAYQFRVRAFKKFGSTKYYSSWSKVVYMIPTPTNIKLSTTAYTYDGKTKTPSLTIKDVNGTKLVKGTDYTVKYASGRKNVGSYKVTITFKGKYSGKVTKTFKINPVKTTVSKLTPGKKSITAAVTKKSKQVSGYQIQYSTSKKFTNAKTKTISSYKTTKYTLKSLSAKKTYYVRVRTYKNVNGVKYYSGWSTYKSVKTK